MQLTKLEKETVIIFNDEEATAEVYTCNSAIINTLRKLEKDHAESVTPVRSDKYSVTYTVPKEWVKIQPPKKMSEKQRKAAAENLRKAQNAKLGRVFSRGLEEKK